MAIAGNLPRPPGVVTNKAGTYKRRIPGTTMKRQKSRQLIPGSRKWSAW